MKTAYVTFIIRNDSFLPGAMLFAYALRKQNTKADLICIISNNLKKSSIYALQVLFDDVIVLDEIYVPHARRQERQDRPFLFSRFHALRLGKDGDLGKNYDKIILADADLLPLEKYDELFHLEAPAGIINEKKEYCMEYTDDGVYTIPKSVLDTGTWIWHEVYKEFPHGHKIPKEVTDRVHDDKENMGVNASLYVLKPSMKLFNDILEDVSKAEVLEEIGTYNWPEMQYLTQKLSGQWTNIDLRYSSFNGYPELSVLQGIHFAGLKPWKFKNKSVKSFAKFEDYKLWYHLYVQMMNDYPILLENGKLLRLLKNIEDLRTNKKYVFYQTYLPNLSAFFDQ
jgi:glycogenin glucosyltransferase